jgi:hypothetical protein
MNIPYKIELLSTINKQDEDKILFYSQFPFYKTELEQKKHMEFFKNRIEQRNKEILKLENLIQ